jgi:hypothetical protein
MSTVGHAADAQSRGCEDLPGSFLAFCVSTTFRCFELMRRCSTPSISTRKGVMSDLGMELSTVFTTATLLS